MGWIGRRDDKNFTFFSPAGECLKTRKKMLESQEFKEASKEDQMLLTEFKPQRSISLDRAHPEMRRTSKGQNHENPDEEKEEAKEKPIVNSGELAKDGGDLEDLEEVVANIEGLGNIENEKEEGSAVSNEDLASKLSVQILEGWTRTGNRGMISPDGSRFRTKRQAIEHLVKVGGSEAHVEALRDLYVEEGWTRDRLPKGWLGLERDKVQVQLFLLFLGAGFLLCILFFVLQFASY